MKTQILNVTLQLLLLMATADCAQAYYDPGVQRWLNRDPIGEIGGINLFAFYRNNLVNKIDALGLCGKTCEQICDDFNKLPDAHVTGKGRVICNGSEKCPCYVPGPNDPAKGECPNFEKIVLDHEKSHFDDVDCPGSNPGHKFPDFPTWKPGVDGDFAECKARVNTINDLRDAIPNASGKCKKAMQDSLDETLAWVMANCD